MSNNNYLYIKNPLFSLLIALSVCFCSFFFLWGVRVFYFWVSAVWFVLLSMLLQIVDGKKEYTDIWRLYIKRRRTEWILRTCNIVFLHCFTVVKLYSVFFYDCFSVTCSLSPLPPIMKPYEQRKLLSLKKL